MKYQSILHIDDDNDDQEIFCLALEQLHEPINCISESSAKTALEKLISKEWQPQAIFLDLNMPVMSGQQFLAEIKSLTELKDIPIFILSTSSHKTTIELMKEMGAADFITKPANHNELIDILKELLT